MFRAKPFQLILTVPIGIALLFAGLFFDNGTADAIQLQVDATPTPDRLAKPTLPAAPSQADHGAQVYWLSCMPCHGDTGQGLTDEFRQNGYPPEDNNCWARGCHGRVPYENGFTLPTAIPAVIEDRALAKFKDAAQLNAYIRATMPFWKPGSLTEEESWRVTAFILRQNNLWDASTDLNASNAPAVKIPRGAFLTPAATPPATAPQEEENGTVIWVIGVGIIILIGLLMFILKKFRNTATI